MIVTVRNAIQGKKWSFETCTKDFINFLNARELRGTTYIRVRVGSRTTNQREIVICGITRRRRAHFHGHRDCSTCHSSNCTLLLCRSGMWRGTDPRIISHDTRVLRPFLYRLNPVSKYCTCHCPGTGNFESIIMILRHINYYTYTC